jgi:hypothetical protein
MRILLTNTKIQPHEVKAFSDTVKTKIHIARNILDELNEKFLNERIGGTHIYHCSLHMELPLCLSITSLGRMGAWSCKSCFFKLGNRCSYYYYTTTTILLLLLLIIIIIITIIIITTIMQGADSTPDVIGCFNWPNPSNRTMALGRLNL